MAEWFFMDYFLASEMILRAAEGASISRPGVETGAPCKIQSAAIWPMTGAS
jgi:hypothetical protein